MAPPGREIWNFFHTSNAKFLYHMHYRSLRGRLPSVYVDEKISVAKTFSDYFLNYNEQSQGFFAFFDQPVKP